MYADLFERLLEDPSFAVYSDANAMKRLDAYKMCDVIDTGVYFFPGTLAFAIPKNSPYFPLFQYHIGQLRETGLIKQYHDENEGEPQVCEEYSGKPITGGQCFTAFTILFVGAGISILWFG